MPQYDDTVGPSPSGRLRLKTVIKALVNRIPYVENLRERIRTQEAQITDHARQIREQGEFPPGHFHSPIPSNDDVLAYLKKPPTKEVLGVDLNEQGQYELLCEYVPFYKDIPFPEQKTSPFRYYYDNVWFSYADAIFLYGFLRKHTPNKIVEVGSGFSSAVILDTVDSCFTQKPEITFIDPNPERLMSLLGDGDTGQVNLIDRKIQDVSADVILELKSGDLLFIDSSHVVKCGSDVQFLLFEILPRLQPGVFVHFHDVFYPFDYPPEWLMEGRYWNENYFLRAFLSYNSQWKIRFMNTYVSLMFNDFIKQQLPLCAKNPGGSLYIQRLEKGAG